MRVTYDSNTKRALIEADPDEDFEKIFQELEVLRVEGLDLFSKRELGEPTLDIHKGERLVLKWDEVTFAGFGVSELASGGPASFTAEQVANPLVNLEAINAWWDKNRIALVARAQAELPTLPRL